MKHVSIFEMKSQLSSLLREAEAGAEIAVTRHGEVIARIVPGKSMTAADLFRDVWAKGGIDFEAPEDSPAEDVPSWDD